MSRITMTAPLAAARQRIRWASAVLAPISFLSAHEPASFPGMPFLSWMRTA